MRSCACALNILLSGKHEAPLVCFLVACKCTARSAPFCRWRSMETRGEVSQQAMYGRCSISPAKCIMRKNIGKLFGAWAARNGRGGSLGHASVKTFISGFSSGQQFKSCSRGSVCVLRFRFIDKEYYFFFMWFTSWGEISFSWRVESLSISYNCDHHTHARLFAQICNCAETAQTIRQGDWRPLHQAVQRNNTSHCLWPLSCR
jgi:hypothetical protein